MKTVIGAVLIVIGLIGLIWGGISWTEEKPLSTINFSTPSFSSSIIFTPCNITPVQI